MKEITLLIGHGSRDTDGNQEFLEFVDAIQNTAPEHEFASCFLELAAPSIPDAIADCVAKGATRIVAVPVILLAASHVKLEIPELLDSARHRHPGLDIVYGRNVGLHERIIDLLLARFHEHTANMPEVNHAKTAIVLMGRGSSDADANGDVYKIARQVWERTGVATVEVCFTGVTFPRLPDGVRRAVSLGAKRIVVLPYFLFTGVLMKRMADLLPRLQADHPDVPLSMADYFGADAHLLATVLDRRQEAAGNAAYMNCDLCKYRIDATHEHAHSHNGEGHHHHHEHPVAVAEHHRPTR